MKKDIIIATTISFFVSITIGTVLGLFGGFLGSKIWLPDVDEDFSVTTQLVDEESAVVAAVDKAGPAVVSIVISKDVPVYEQYFEDPFYDDPFFSPFSIPQYEQKGTEKQEVGGGSGFIVSRDGYVVTNKHVVSETDAEYTVYLKNGDKYEAEVMAKDPFSDLAVLKIQGENFATLSLGDSDNLKPGQSVIAIGYALGEFKNTVSKGVVSGLGRSITATDEYGYATEQLDNIIQTDAAINHGNSGGPLLNIQGQVIGINVAVSEVGENIGFALSINDAKNVIESVKQTGKIVRPYLGVRYVPITKELQTKNQLSVDYGVLVVRGETATDLAVMPSSPADKAGLEENDIILEFDGQKIDAENDLQDYIFKKKPGDKVKLNIIHDGEQKKTTVVLEEWQDS